MKLSFPSTQLRAQRPITNSSSSVTTRKNPSPQDEPGELELSSTEYARTRKDLIQLTSDLCTMGAQTRIDLPCIVVIGAQSAGKSSLVEAISGVNVPRDSGTCTRCPVECTISTKATTWSCKIKLRFDYGPDGQSAAHSKKVDFGPVITDRNEVDVWLRRAQAAILNPNLPPSSFDKKTTDDLRNSTSTFSRNVVSIFIKDPAATDLFFVDLPGLIQNEEPHIVDLVQQLTESYISRPNAIILTTIPMSDDIQNQLSVRLARDVDLDGERTIGVLTKPDMLGDGAIDARREWIEVIEGRRHRLKHGYYCVRLPNDAERGQHLSRPELQRRAAGYFATTSPWSEVTDRRRFGIPNFVSDISALLVRHIRTSLPQLRQDVERLLASCLNEIRTLPEPLKTDPQIEVLARVNDFCAAFKRVVSGTSLDKSLAQQNRALYAKFAQAVRGTAPDFRPFEQPEAHARIGALETEEAVVEPNIEVQTMGLHEVRKVIAESTAWELPGNIPYDAKTRLINQFTTLWLAPAEECLGNIYDVLDDVVQQLVKTHFGRFGMLQDLVLSLIYPDVEEHKRRALSAVKEMLELETSTVYTQSVKDFLTLRDKWLAKYRNARRNSPTYGIFENATHEYVFSKLGSGVEGLASPIDLALCYLAQGGLEGVTVEDLTRLYPRDKQFDGELAVMAEVRAYFTVASKRIIDHVPLQIEHSLHHALGEGLSVGLLQRLMVDAASAANLADRMRELVSEDPEVGKKRDRLEATRSRLQEIKRRLGKIAA